MIKAKFISALSYPWQRQFPKQSCIWNDVLFSFDEDDHEFDFLVVYRKMAKDIDIPPTLKERTILILAEDPFIRKFRHGFQQQFGLVISTGCGSQRHNILYGQPSFTWFLGLGGCNFLYPSQVRDEHNKIWNYEDFTRFNPPKTKRASIIVSNKSLAPGHQKRYQFGQYLKRHFGDDSDIDFYGGAFDKPFIDKMEALADYDYHIAIENHVNHGYWTEKLIDPFLTLTVPIYNGCVNIHDYFSPQMLHCIDIDQPKKAVAAIENIIKDRPSQEQMEYLKQARELCMNQYNIFAVLSEQIHKINKSAAGQKTLSRIKKERAHLYHYYAKLFGAFCIVLKKIFGAKIYRLLQKLYHGYKSSSVYRRVLGTTAVLFKQNHP